MLQANLSVMLTGNVVMDEIGTVITEPGNLPANETYKVTKEYIRMILYLTRMLAREDDWAWIAQRIDARTMKSEMIKDMTKKLRESVQATEANG